MTEPLHTIRFPGESDEYRRARDELLEAEIDLRRRTEAVAAKRRSLPLGGTVPEDYRFEESDPDVERVRTRGRGAFVMRGPPSSCSRRATKTRTLGTSTPFGRSGTCST